jgi:ribosomal protein S18 acetylase RimI-like enzyme
MPGCSAARGARLPRIEARRMQTIRRATLDDAQAMLELQRRAFAEEGRRSGSQEIPPLIEALAAIQEHILLDTALLAVDRAKVVGSVRGIVADRVCTIRALVVEPEMQGRGVGSSLLRALEAAHPGVERFDLTTNTVMDRNVPFYQRHGYCVTKLTHYSEEVTLAQMSKTVSRKP